MKREKVLERSLMKETENCIEEIAYMNNGTLFEGKLCAGVLEYFCKLQKKKKYKELYVIINHMFPECNEEFLYWVANKMGLVREVRFADGFKNWQRNNFLEKRGRKKLPLQTMQIISKVWYENSIPSVDCRNGRESVAIRKSLYAQRYHADLYHEQPLIKKKKRSGMNYTSTRRIVTCTNPKIVY